MKPLPHARFIIFLAIFTAATPALLPWLGGVRALLTGFAIAAASFVVLTLVSLRAADGPALRLSAAKNDAGRWFTLLVSAVLTAVLLVLVGVEATMKSRLDGATVALSVTTLVMAWLFGNVVYALHYAHLYYDPEAGDGDHGGLDIPGGCEPDFLDFCYFAFTVGMTFQVSDMQVRSRRIRRVVLVHGALSFLFNIGIVALTINLVASAI